MKPKSPRPTKSSRKPKFVPSPSPGGAGGGRGREGAEPDLIVSAIVAEIRRQGLSLYAAAKLAGRNPRSLEQAIADGTTLRTDLASDYLRALGLTVTRPIPPTTHTTHTPPSA